MTTPSRSVIPERLLRAVVALPGMTVALLVAGLLSACSSSDDGLGKDSGTDSRRDQAPAPADSPPDLTPGPLDQAPSIGCSFNGQTYLPGQTVVMPGACPMACVCLANGNFAQCTGGCPPEGGAPDLRPPADVPPADAPIVCRQVGRTYSPGEVVPANDGCGGTCICQADGTIGHCTGLCGPDGGPDGRPDSGPDQGVDRAPDVNPPIDTACSGNSPCTTATGGRGLCTAGTCTACAGAQDDSKCAAVYGTGTICAGGACVAGTCHDSNACITDKKVCDATHTCQSCASDLQCQNDSVYGRNTICLSNGQCVAGVCHTSGDCQGSKLCDAATHLCSSCTTDPQCQADTVYGSKSICVSEQCVAGACNTSADCRTKGARLCPTATKVCTACTSDTECRSDTAYGAGFICSDGQCVSGSCSTSRDCTNGRVCNATTRVCVACNNDTRCTSDTVYGPQTICLSGACVTGDCHDISSECSAGRICGSSVPHACGDCSADAQCTADARYGTGFLCVSNLCVRGNCHDTSNDCNQANGKAGQVCGASTPHTCGACTTDSQCKNDAKYGATTVCTTTANLSTTGQCVSNGCNSTAAGDACPANAADVCCGSTGSRTCIPGNCCSDTDCQTDPRFGDGFFCRQNTCTSCDAVTGNSYVVDPVAGNDSIATGSGLAGGAAVAGCSFRTVTRALLIIGPTAPAGTTITIVGRTSGTTSLYTVQSTGGPPEVETLPIDVRANITITTRTGPIRLTLGADKVGFRLLGDNANLQPITAAALTIDSGNHVSSSGIIVAAGTGTARIRNVTVTGTGEDGIQVSGGTAQIESGVHVTAAGTAADSKNGLSVSGGTVNITVTAADPNTTFEQNTASGIAVTGTGVLNITGATVTGGTRSVLVQNNTGNNIDFRPNAPVTSTPTSVIDGVYSYASADGDGLYILASRRIRVRNSIFQANGGNGIHIASAGAAAAENSLSSIDLGTTGTGGSYGRNLLQTLQGDNPNIGAGVCVELATAAGTQTLAAAGNRWNGKDCSANPTPSNIRTSTTCSGRTDLAIVPATVTATVTNCTLP